MTNDYYLSHDNCILNNLARKKQISFLYQKGVGPVEWWTPGRVEWWKNAGHPKFDSIEDLRNEGRREIKIMGVYDQWVSTINDTINDNDDIRDQ